MKKRKLKIPFLSDLSLSFKAVQWPTAKDLALNLLTVLVISAIIGGYLWLLDTGFGELRNLILFE